MSTTREPPMASRGRRGRGLGGDLGDDRRLAADGVGAERGEGGVGRVGGDDRDQLALVGDVDRVDPEDLAGTRDLRTDRDL
jgi:hypothetical protein